MWSTLASINCSRRSGEVSITIRVIPCSDVRSASNEQRRRRFFGFLGSHAPQPSAGRGTPAEDPQPRIVRFSVMPQLSERHLAEQPEEILGGLPRNLLQRDPARLRQHLGNLDHIGRLVALAAKFAGRQIRRVGLDHDAIGRQLGREIAQGLRFLEGQNARERNRKPQRDRLHRKFPPAGVAMQHGAKRPFGHFLLEDAAAIFVGLAGMNHQRQAGGAGGRDMGAKAALLCLRASRSRRNSPDPPRPARRPSDAWSVRSVQSAEIPSSSSA